MSRWATFSLADICHIQSTLVDPRRDPYLDLPHIGAGNIASGTGEMQGIKSARDERLISGKFLFDETMVLYSKIRPYLMKVARPKFSGLCSADIYPLVPKPGRAVRDFLYYLLLTESFTKYAMQGSARAGMPKVNREHLFAYQARTPPIGEQRRIVAILDEAFEGIATAKANAEKNLQNARELFENYLQAVFTDCGPDWSSATIDQHVRFIDYRGRTPEKTSKGLRLITAKNVKKGFIQQEPMEFVAPESFMSWMTRGIPKFGDVLFTTEAPLGNVAQLDTGDRVVFAQRVIIMQADPAVLDSTFLKYMLLSTPIQSRIHAQATGATAQGIKASLLKRIVIAFPKTVAEQLAIVDRLDALADESKRLEELYANRLASLDELKETLLHHAFTGALTAKAVGRQPVEVE